MARIYVAGSYARREELFERAKDLVMAGHSVTSRWLKGNDTLSKQDQIDMDLTDLLAADTLLVFPSPASDASTGGHHAELGYAQAMNDTGDKRRLMIVGWPVNLFHHRSDVEQYADFETAQTALCLKAASL